jgi:hypothetical protein
MKKFIKWKKYFFPLNLNFQLPITIVHQTEWKKITCLNFSFCCSNVLKIYYNIDENVERFDLNSNKMKKKNDFFQWWFILLSSNESILVCYLTRTPELTQIGISEFL